MAAIRTFPDTMNSAPGSIWSSRTLIKTLFTKEEAKTFANSPEGMLFISYITANPIVDITSEEFKTDLEDVVKANLLTQDRANEILAGKEPANISL